MIIESAAVNALIVSKPSEGGQSITIYSYFSLISVSAFCNINSIFLKCMSSTSAADRSTIDVINDKFGILY